jgi:STE24 endopeptidase
MVRVTRCVLRFVLLCTVLTAFATAQSPGAIPAPPAPPVADRHASAEPFDIKAAVDAYLAKMPPAERARSNAYFEGGYWLLLGDFLLTVV